MMRRFEAPPAAGALGPELRFVVLCAVTSGSRRRGGGGPIDMHGDQARDRSPSIGVWGLRPQLPEALLVSLPTA